jgi:DNA-binding CsgD family transcriptional regulator
MPGAALKDYADSRFGSEAVERLRVAFVRSRHPMLIADDQRRWITGNAAAHDLLGLTPEAVPWHTMDEFTPPSARGKLEAHWDALLTSGAIEGWDRLFIPGRGPLPVEFSATAHVLPSRHLAVFMPPDEASTPADAERALARDVTWAPRVLNETVRLHLTEREREVMTLVASGLQSGEIAERLFLSPATIKSHVQNAMGKLGAHTRAHAVAVALVAGQIAWET